MNKLGDIIRKKIRKAKNSKKDFFFKIKACLIIIFNIILSMAFIWYNGFVLLMWVYASIWYYRKLWWIDELIAILSVGISFFLKIAVIVGSFLGFFYFLYWIIKRKMK